MIRKVSVLALAAASLLALTGPVDAARGGNKGAGARGGGGSASSISINEAAPYVHGQSITVTVNTGDTDRPFSTVECFQGGTLVYSSTRGHFQDYYDYFGEPVHYLSSMAWPAGDADCTASLTYQARNGRTRTAASVGFQVNG